ncbi:hypothetical protein CSOJ01_06163 [Colletotrichum sojae]|uniref:Uncharacterized protein n=1 Tax=Colletotrichum sojae TaxID=2175907 RepID=A0A8H6JCR4_9PEZI|nr:hypothetical protein CSOJ01_06163 [Colletotrichum sojae]
MVSLRSAALALFAASATAQKLQPWGQQNFGSAAVTDFDTSTYVERVIDGAPRISLLFNRVRFVTGVYVQSSGDFVTDYEFSLTGFLNAGATRVEFQVCGAKSNFTYVPFVNPDGDGKTLGITTDTLFLSPLAANNGAQTVRINEIYPIFSGDEVFHPNNTSPCAN